LAKAGASVIVADLNAAGADAVAEEIRGFGGAATAVQVDITDEASVQAMMDATVAAYGGLDILVNNAALMVEAVGTPTHHMSVADFERLMRVNVTGALICSKAAVPLFKARGGGRIVNQSSAGAFPAQSAYGISKIAIVGLTTTLATELGPLNIGVNCIAPGMVRSDAGLALTPEESPFVKAVMARVVKRPRGEPDELVGALLLLCSDAGDWMSGQVLNVDGGFIMRN
jgi:NAD(P)-dependent dehydrogenase (short-subunit alcohol dehydrogenase family)